MLRKAGLSSATTGTKSHKRAPKQEKELARRFGGRVTPGSGNKHIKGDIRKKGVVRIEAKTTMARSFSVTLEMINKIEDAALSTNEMPAIVVEFNDGNGRRIKDVAIVPMYVLDLLVNGDE